MSTKEEVLPDDYETCGTCGFDHEYDGCDVAVHAEIIAIHLEDERRTQREEQQMQRFVTECEKSGAPICSFCLEDRDIAYRAGEFEHRLATRVTDLARLNAKIPRYWLEDGMVFVLVGLRQEGDGPDPSGWVSYLYPDAQLAATDRFCRKVCSLAHLARAHVETEESGDAIWFGYRMADEVWGLVKDTLISLLGEPGAAPPRLRIV